MFGLRWVAAGLITVALSQPPSVVKAADAPPAGEAPSLPELLKEKELTQTGFLLVLRDETSLHDGLKTLRTAKVQVDNDAKARHAAEEAISKAKGPMGQIETAIQKANAQLAKVSGAGEQNQLIGQINALNGELKHRAETVQEMEQQLSKLSASQANYIGIVLDMSTRAEKLAAKYDALAKDEAFKAALDKINLTAKPKLKLGPSGTGTIDLALVKKLSGEVLSATIPVKMDHGVPQVEVLFNGEISRTVIFDSGSSIVSITADFADKLGMHPAETDPTLHMQLADGRTVEAKQMVIKSIRIGAFTVEKVECAVLPPSMQAAENLLGGTFLRNFVYKLDPVAGELHLTQLLGASGTGKPSPKP